MMIINDDNNEYNTTEQLNSLTDDVVLENSLRMRQHYEKNISKVYFDRGENRYHGRVKAFAETLRKNGLKF